MSTYTKPTLDGFKDGLNIWGHGSLPNVFKNMPDRLPEFLATISVSS